MVGASKILTVSYGTFSCTLEGFDDPFSTMKSIAEYFRDLAADDRYFGAEPPTPDAEMLHRIAEKEVQRRVEARVQEDGIVLRQMDAAPAAAAPVAAAAALAADTIAEPEVQEAEATAPESHPEPVAEPVAEEVEAPVAEELVAEAATPEIAPEIEEDVAEAPFDDTPAESVAAEPMPADDGSIAAKLSRIRAVVSRSRAEAAPEDDEFETPVTPASDFSAPIESAFADPDDIDGLVAEDEEVTAPEAPAFEDTAELAEPEAPAFEETEAEETAFADDTPLAEETTDEFEDEGVTNDEAVMAQVQTRIIELEDAAEIKAEAPETGLSDEDEAELMQELAEAEAEAETDAEETGENLFAESLADDDADDDVEHEFEEEIAAEAPDQDNDVLAAIARMQEDEADDGDVTPAEAHETTQEEAAEDTPADRHAAFEPEKSEEAAFDRILEETNHKLDDTESSRRRSAIAHLKAAVAATKADRLLKRVKHKDEQDAEEQSQYRNDLAKVVRPRRPVSEGRPDSTHERPAPLEEAGSPLMLVSEQRVDEEDGEERKAVLPRRVNKSALALDTDAEFGDGDTSFADFAEEMGATELPDLLEAAAAYSAFVEGRREFSRPQLMRRVASFERDTFTREAGLRSFGQLLRQGKIQKLKRGQFTISEDTRFNPEARMAGE